MVLVSFIFVTLYILEIVQFVYGCCNKKASMASKSYNL